MLRRDRSISRERRNATIDTERTAAIDEVIAGFEGLMHLMADSHAPEFLEIGVTMPQAKLLYLLGAAGELHMSELVLRLRVSLSTVSGLVDRIVEAGLAARRDDPADRRQVVVELTPAGHDLIDRFRELNARGMRELLSQLDDAELDSVRAALVALIRAAQRTADRPGPAAAASPSVASPARKDPA